MNRPVLVAVLTAATVSWLAAAPEPETEFPFELDQGLLWVQVHANDSPRPLSFLLDTGAEVSVIHLATARDLGLKLGAKVQVRGVNATLTGHWPQQLTASAGGVKLPSKYLGIDLSPLSRACGRPVEGLIGADFFRQRVVVIDFARQKIRVLNDAAHLQTGRFLPLDIRANKMRVPVRVNGGQPQWLLLDTGCASALQWVTRHLTAECPQTEVTGLTRASVAQMRTKVELGGHFFSDVLTGVHSNPLLCDEAGLVGNGLLATFASVTIDAKAGRLALEGGSSVSLH